MSLRPRKLPTPVQRKDGQWLVRWRYKVSGVEHRPQRLFPTQADANAFILRELVDASTLAPADRARTFSTYADMWLDVLPTEVGDRDTTLKIHRW